MESQRVGHNDWTAFTFKHYSYPHFTEEETEAGGGRAEVEPGDPASRALTCRLSLFLSSLTLSLLCHHWLGRPTRFSRNFLNIWTYLSPLCICILVTQVPTSNWEYVFEKKKNITWSRCQERTRFGIWQRLLLAGMAEDQRWTPGWGKHWSRSCGDELGESGGDTAQVEWNNVKKPRGPKSRTVIGEGWMH